GLLVIAGLSLVLWAVTPSLSDPGALLRGAVVAFAAGSGADVSVGDAVLTLPPLLIGLLGWVLLWQAVGRSSALPTTPARAVVLASAAGFGQAAVVLGAAVVVGGSSGPSASSAWAPVLMALVVS